MFVCQDVQCAARIGTSRERGVDWAVFVGRQSWSFTECAAKEAPTAGFCAGCKARCRRQVAGMYLSHRI